MDKTGLNIPERFRDHPIFNELICGTNFGFMNKRGYYNTEFARAQPALMHQMGVNWTTLNINLCQETLFSTKMFLDFEYTVSDSEIIDMTKRLHENGVRVLLKPCFTSLDGAAMCCLTFPPETSFRQIQGVRTDYWEKWFASYMESMKYFADLARRSGADSMMIGAELLGTEGQEDSWNRVIDVVRQRYDGPITYEFTYASRYAHKLEWFKRLDYLSYSYYPPAAAPNMDPLDGACNPGAKDAPHWTVEEMVKYLEPRKKRIQSIIERFDGKPIAFTEFGVRSAHGSVMLPYNFLWETYYDGQEQANYMEAAFRTFSDLPGFMGLFWWKWDETQNRPHYHTDPSGDLGFTIQGKPAEDVMRKWFLKNRK